MVNNFTVLVALLLLATIAYQIGLVRSRGVASGGAVRLHSRPGYHGALAILRSAVPAAAVYVIWRIIGGPLIDSAVLSAIPVEHLPTDPNEQRLLLRRLANFAGGFGAAGDIRPFEQVAADHLLALRARGQAMTFAAMTTAAAFGLFWSWRRTTPQTRARNKVERAVTVGLITCSAVAVLTTLGIVLSMLGEAVRFFSFVSPAEFFLGTTWNPRFSHVGAEGQTGFGMLPLLVGTLMIATIAMMIAVPLGLMTAIYLAEYASHTLRAWAKPAIEVLAGIPTIVYGFFALVTVGPFLSDLGAMLGLNIRATSALTAGVVMGIMIIPFVSSLSDDIITQVPRALRDGSLALGGTISETIRRVVLPAALPGIVGALLLAVSRAIGETMIVVLAAGNAPILTANPFEAVSTVTVAIVNQLTGDQDFASPQSLVAFALGLTLFVMTLVLNVIALVVVRRYREQYE